ncbi:EexN family lipoprotein [uncultured Amphritea sp.]|jgi:hypothetical protein|uniref:EexN family lipoprotein n=1 Tax=uncultured Amphritea sp. TaxID=981605 RepID=UPI0026111BAA|nr:EexN family lipoprotein [uncultured Amphritea sp.]
MKIYRISCARKIALMVLVSFALTGCFDKGPDTGPLKTVDWYKAHDDERQKILKLCSNNPGELEDDANCINALQAERAQSFGKPKDIEW